MLKLRVNPQVLSMPNLWRKPFDSEDKASTPGEVHVESAQCKGCGYCVEFCPRKVLVMGDVINSKGYTYAQVAAGKDCLCCGLCEIICPEFAIKVTSHAAPVKANNA